MHIRMYEKAEEIIKTIKTESDRNQWKKQIESLQALGVIPSSLTCREEKKNEISLAGLFFKSGEELEQGLRKYWINKNIQQKQCEDEEAYIKQNVRIGTEFTFHHPTFLFTMKDLEKSSSDGDYQKNNREKGIDDGNRIIAQWTADLQREYSRQKLLSGSKITAVNTGHGHKKYTNAAYEAVEIMFEIEIKDTLQDLQDRTFLWKVNFDLDPSCIELQADPMPYCFFANCGYCIETLLFRHTGKYRRTSKYGLEADKSIETGGGGHISLDVGAAFSGNAVYMRNFLVLYSCEALKASIEKTAKEQEKELTEEQKKWMQRSFLTEEQRQLLSESKDVANAPFLFEADEWLRFKHFIADFDRQQASIEEFVRGMQEQVYVNATRELEIAMGGAEHVEVGDKWHYQAVNLEHVHDDGRIELRRFDAQESINELLQQTEVLFQILMMARTNRKISIDKALESDYFA